MPPSSEQDERRPGPADDATREQVGTRAEARLDVVLAVDWVSPSIVRERVQAWLLAHRWSPAQADDLVLAVNEAVTNSIEHGYGVHPEEQAVSPRWAHSSVEVRGEVILDEQRRRRVELTIVDGGRWRPPTVDPDRGNGITLMRACADNVTISPGDNGTTVHLLSRPLPPSPGIE